MGKRKTRPGQFQPWLDHAPSLREEEKPGRRAEPRNPKAAGQQQSQQGAKAIPHDEQPWWSRD